MGLFKMKMEIKLPNYFTASKIFKTIFVFQILSFIVIVFLIPTLPTGIPQNKNYRDITIDSENKIEHTQIKEYSDRFYPIPEKKPGKLPLNINLPNYKTEGLKFKEISFPNLGLGLLVSGGITAGDSERFRSKLNNFKKGELKFIALHSPGGYIEEALDIGKQIRKNKLQTVITQSATCLSACPYIFAGGTQRLKASNSFIGVHQTYYYEDTLIPFYFAVEDVQKSHAELFRYFKEMNINHNIMEFILDTSPEDIYLLEDDQLIKFNLVTELVTNV